MEQISYKLENGLELLRCRNGRPGIRKKADDGKLKELPIRLVRCFPWLHADNFISIRDAAGKEIALLESLDIISDDATRKMLQDELDILNYVPVILKIAAIRHEAELYNWLVETDAGKRSFYMRRNEIPRQIALEGILIKDIGGDRYRINRVEDLDRKSKDWLWAYLD